MGHYDSSHDHEAKQQLEKKRDKFGHALAHLDILSESLCNAEVPEKFHDHLEDLSNYLTANLPK